jgi:ribokinase
VAVARAGAQVAHIGRVGDDAFVGVLTVALAKGKSMIEAVRWGNAAGALAATGIGAQTSLPMRDELDRFIAEHYL